MERVNDGSPRFWQIFLDVFEALPRQGPGNRACAERALAQCRDLPPAPAVIDLGCGVGGQTMHLAELLDGPILAIDNHPPNIVRLRATIAERGLGDRVEALLAEMSQLDLPAASFDLVWSEGALYNVGIGNALRICRRLLRPGGYLAFTDAVWRKDDPPEEVRWMFDLDYPAMGRVEDVLARIDERGFDLVDHFTLPDEAWWDDFYAPMLTRIEALRRTHAGDEDAIAALDRLAQEPELHRRHSSYYAYEFFVARSPQREA